VIVLISILFPGLVVLSGILPIFIAKLTPSSFSAHSYSGYLNKKASFINNSLLVLQFTVSIVVIISSLIMNKQNSFLFRKELGHNNKNIVMLQRPSTAEDSQAILLKDELLKTPAVEDVSMCMVPPGYLAKDQRAIEIAEIPEENKKQYLTILPIDSNFFSFFNLPFVAGGEKEFSEGQQHENYILNESAIKKLGFHSAQSAIGTRFKIEDLNNSGIVKGGAIVGVVKDFNFSSLYNPIEATIFFPKSKWQFQYLVKLSPGITSKSLASITQVWKKVFPDSSFNYRFLDDVYQEFYSRDVITNKLVSWFSVICLILSSIGLWGISQITVTRKTKWIGICKVNGARVSEVLSMLNKDFVKWILIAFVIACPIGWYITHKWLQNFAYKTEVSWWLFAIAGLLALVIALLTVSRLSWKAATRNPVEALRYE
jgi:putative ABC transport system permease protein